MIDIGILIQENTRLKTELKALQEAYVSLLLEKREDENECNLEMLQS